MVGEQRLFGGRMWRRDHTLFVVFSFPSPPSPPLRGCQAQVCWGSPSRACRRHVCFTVAVCAWTDRGGCGGEGRARPPHVARGSRRSFFWMATLVLPSRATRPPRLHTRTHALRACCRPQIGRAGPTNAKKGAGPVFFVVFGRDGEVEARRRTTRFLAKRGWRRPRAALPAWVPCVRSSSGRVGEWGGRHRRAVRGVGTDRTFGP